MSHWTSAGEKDSTMPRNIWTIGFATALLTLGVQGARAQTTVTDIATSSWTEAGNYGSGSTPDDAARPSGNQGSGLTFADLSERFITIGAGVGAATKTFDFAPIALGSDSVFNSIMQLSADVTSPDVFVQFTNSLGQEQSYTLIPGATIRTADGAQSLTGSGTGVTAQAFYAASGWQLDAQTFALPTDWSGTSLDSMTITYEGSYLGLSAMQVSTDLTSDDPSGPDDSGPGDPVPEPMSLAMLGVGCLGLAGARRR
jgi:hypothetical protein